MGIGDLVGATVTFGVAGVALKSIPHPRKKRKKKKGKRRLTSPTYNQLVKATGINRKRF